MSDLPIAMKETPSPAVGDRLRWSEEEDTKFINALLTHRGISFAKLQREFLPNRTLDSLRGRFRVLREKGHIPSQIQSFRARDIGVEPKNNENETPSIVSYGTNGTDHDGGTKRPQEGEGAPCDGLDSKRRRELSQGDVHLRNSVNYDVSNDHQYRADINDNESPDVSLEGENRTGRILEITKGDDFAKIYEKARMCYAETKRANDALQAKTELEARLKAMEEEVKELREAANAKKETGKEQGMQVLKPAPERRGVEAAWALLRSNARQLFSIKTWQDDGLEGLFDKLLEASLQEENQHSNGQLQ
ncbi:uncharacterized protein GIQ15_04992 [Arthroderma uncinatum]|uniref:uncharacterized protein n=1 Tax=Arthroderma uncinatum TaxID=74035 RepID=UPI00144A7932|nr:uncharacterized protein GIQ15_04992 [Arthroderma uncinatum]KAF3482233.1 hypothetical protein GIQ15_04992 [Arthroderma uncinatum]